jgi:hypothetical protein
MDQLGVIHQRKRMERTDYPKAMELAPPLMSHLETFTILNGEYHTMFHAESVFYRSCLGHIRRAQDAVPTAGEWAASSLDRVYQERIEAVVAGAACLEALANRLGRLKHAGVWEDVEGRLNPQGKWYLILVLAGKGAEYDTSCPPFQTLQNVFKKRNELLHFKPQMEPVDRHPASGSARTAMQALLPDDFVNQLAGQLKELVVRLCTAVGEPKPEWVESGPGWIEPHEEPLSDPRPMPQPPAVPTDYVTRVKAAPLKPPEISQSGRRTDPDAPK